MLQLLSVFPEDVREDLVYISQDGQVYTNRVVNKQNTTVIRKNNRVMNDSGVAVMSEESRDAWRDQDGNPYLLALPSQSPRPEPIRPFVEIEPQASVVPLCQLNGMGIEFRMHTKAGAASSSVPQLIGSKVRIDPPRGSNEVLVDDPTGLYFSASNYESYGCANDVQKDDKNTAAIEGLGESPYVYLGGWGGNYDPITRPKTRVDAGLQFNCAEGWYPHYSTSIFFLQEAFGATLGTYANRFSTTQPIDLSFKVINALTYSSSGEPSHHNFLLITATGRNHTDTAYQTKTLSVIDDGWNHFGKDNILSFSTSIAQTPHSAAGEYNHSNSIFKNIGLSNLKVSSPSTWGPWGEPVDYSWNGYSLNDPLTALNGICTLPGSDTTNSNGRNDPIEVYGSDIASSSGIRVDMITK